MPSGLQQRDYFFKSQFSMSIRGRGTLEVKPSRNPFLQSTSSDIGVNPQDKVDWNYDMNPSLLQGAVSSHAKSENFAFLYTRESDRIGSKVKKPKVSVVPTPMTRTEFLKKRREELLSSGEVTMMLTQYEKQGRVEKPSAEQILKFYKHQPKEEDPRYTLQSNEYGKKIPTAATFVAERAQRPQGFSNSFNNIKPQNSSLNTSISKSTVHPSLDPQFV